jgi:hypothetical protein
VHELDVTHRKVGVLGVNTLTLETHGTVLRAVLHDGLDQNQFGVAVIFESAKTRLQVFKLNA